MLAVVNILYIASYYHLKLLDFNINKYNLFILNLKDVLLVLNSFLDKA